MDHGYPIPDLGWPISRDSIPPPTSLSPFLTSQLEEKDGINHDLTFFKNSLSQSKINSASIINVADRNLKQMQNNFISDNIDKIINDGNNHDNDNNVIYYDGINHDELKGEKYDETLLRNVSGKKNNVFENQRIDDENNKENDNSNDDSSSSSSNKSHDSSSQDNHFGDNIVMNLSSSTSSTSASSFSIYGSLLRKF